MAEEREESGSGGGAAAVHEGPSVVEAAPAAPAAPVAIAAPKTRDRIVVLGRTQAGKTIFLACLYYRLWKTDEGDLRIRAVDGQTHRACIETIETLRAGDWPSSTTGSRYLNFIVSYRGREYPLVSLDYPGEVFRRAFIDGADTPDVRDLLDHIDRAAGVVALVDPAVTKGRLTDAMDDDFGMLKAIERIRSWPGGESTPVVLVLTKHDRHAARIERAGGPAAFVRRHYAALAQAVPGMKTTVCSAVREQGDDRRPVLDSRHPPRGVVEPVAHLIREIDRREAAERDAARQRGYAQVVREAAEREHSERTRSILLWTAFWCGMVLVLGIAGLTTWFSMRGE